MPQIDTKEKAFDCLVYAIHLLIERKKEISAIRKVKIISTPKKESAVLSSIVNDLLQETREGEIITLVVAGLYYLYMHNISKNFKIDVHPVNQCGASSKEISDLDIYKNGILFAANELKDKSFSKLDVEHAVSKVREAGFDKMFFIYGLNAEYDEEEISSYIRELKKEGFLLTVLRVDLFSQMLISLTEKTSINSFISFMMDSAHKHKFTTETAFYIRQVAGRHVDII